MSATAKPARTSHEEAASGKLTELARLAASDIPAAISADIGEDLHRLFDYVSEAALPIYFGPLLGRLYLEGL